MPERAGRLRLVRGALALSCRAAYTVSVPSLLALDALSGGMMPVSLLPSSGYAALRRSGFPALSSSRRLPVMGWGGSRTLAVREGQPPMAGPDVGCPGKPGYEDPPLMEGASVGCQGEPFEPESAYFPRRLGQARLPIAARPCPPAAQGSPSGLVPRRACPAPVRGGGLDGVVAHREAHAMGRSCPRSLGQYGSDVNDPALNCMRTEDGGAVCSDGVQYPPGCPRTPPESFFSPGIAPWVDAGGYLVGKVPPPRSADGASPPAAAPPGSPALLPILAAGAGAALLYFLGGR